MSRKEAHDALMGVNHLIINYVVTIYFARTPNVNDLVYSPIEYAHRSHAPQAIALLRAGLDDAHRRICKLSNAFMIGKNIPHDCDGRANARPVEESILVSHISTSVSRSPY
jgi:hypothetical protein